MQHSRRVCGHVQIAGGGLDSFLPKASVHVTRSQVSAFKFVMSQSTLLSLLSATGGATSILQRYPSAQWTTHHLLVSRKSYVGQEGGSGVTWL